LFSFIDGGSLESALAGGDKLDGRVRIGGGGDALTLGSAEVGGMRVVSLVSLVLRATLWVGRRVVGAVGLELSLDLGVSLTAPAVVGLGVLWERRLDGGLFLALGPPVMRTLERSLRFVCLEETHMGLARWKIRAGEAPARNPRLLADSLWPCARRTIRRVRGGRFVFEFKRDLCSSIFVPQTTSLVDWSSTAKDRSDGTKG